MLKKLVLILGLNCFIDVLHSMEELAENLGNNTLGEKISCNLSQLEEAWLKEDRIAVRNLTYFENFIDEENRLNLCGYFENLKQLGICPSLWYNYLMLIADDCIIHEKDIVVLHNLVEQLISNPIDSAEIFKNMLFLIRRFSPEALNAPNQGSNLLNYIVTILKKLDQKLNLLPKRRLKYIAAELLKNGANPSALDTTDIIFNQTEFYKEYQKRFEKCQKKYALKKAILEAYFNGKVDEVETLTCFSQFILDEDRIDLDGYLRKLDKLNIQHSVYDDICVLNYANIFVLLYLYN